MRLSPDVRQSPRKAITEEGVLERPSPHGRTHHGGDAEMAEATPPPPHGDGRADGNGGGGGGADSSSANSPLTPEQKRRMATNRERAMEIRKARKMQQQPRGRSRGCCWPLSEAALEEVATHVTAETLATLEEGAAAGGGGADDDQASPIAMARAQFRRFSPRLVRRAFPSSSSPTAASSSSSPDHS